MENSGKLTFFSKIAILLLCFHISLPILSSESSLEGIAKLYPEVIGKGGHGEIRTKKGDSTVIKLSKKSNVCSDYKKEFEIQSQIYGKYNSLSHPKGFKERATILKPEKYEEAKSFCFFKMERLRPVLETSPLLDQLYLGETADYDKIIKIDDYIRGHYIGFNQVEQIVNKYPKHSADKSNMEQLCYDFGRLLATVQLAAKFDGNDFELVLSKSTGKPPYKISIIDFDKMESMADLFKDFKEENIKKIVTKTEWVFEAEPYVPDPSSDCYKNFAEGYLGLAKQLDAQERTNFYSKTAQAMLDNFKQNF